MLLLISGANMYVTSEWDICMLLLVSGTDMYVTSHKLDRYACYFS